MDIEILKGREIEKTRELYEEVFQDSREYTDYFYKKVCREGIGFAAREYGEIASEMFLLPKTLLSDGRLIKAMYLYGVATKEKYRGQGFMDRLIKEALCCAKESGAEFLYLIPVRASLYEKYGFCTIKQGKVQVWQKTEYEKREAPVYSFEAVSDQMFDNRLCREISLFEERKPCGLYPFRDGEYFADRIRRSHIEGGEFYLIRKRGRGGAEGFIATGEQEGEAAIMDIVARKTEKEKIVQDFISQRGEKSIKEYVFAVMVKKFKNEIIISKVGINDEI